MLLFQNKQFNLCKMKIISFSISFVLFLLPTFLGAQKKSEFLPEKPGKWTYRSNINRPGTEAAAFNKNLAVLAEWVHQNIPMLTNPKGFDLLATSSVIWDDQYKKNICNYGLRSEMNFAFQLFLSDLAGGGKWVVEPPHYSFYINNTKAGHGGRIREGKTGSLLADLFVVFPMVEEITPGVRYYDRGTLVVYNPERPEYWLPVTVKEVVQAKLEDCKDDKFMYDFIKPLIDNMSEGELNAPAFNQSDDGILKVNGNGDGLQYMRFNPNYWDKSLPHSAIQFISFYYSEYGYFTNNKEEEEIANKEFISNNGRINYPFEINKSLPLKELPRLITKDK
jgi:hypothetical protein